MAEKYCNKIVIMDGQNHLILFTECSRTLLIQLTTQRWSFLSISLVLWARYEISTVYYFILKAYVVVACAQPELLPCDSLSNPRRASQM